MTVRLTTLGGSDWSDGQVLYAADQNDTLKKIGFVPLGGIIHHVLSITNATTLAACRTAGFAVCDGTTPAAQGVTAPVITTTPNLTGLFLRGNATTSGGTGGSATNSHTHTVTVNNSSSPNDSQPNLGSRSFYTGTTSGPSDTNNLPPYYEVVLLIRVK